jgi:leader peptidase (prepilin peptidase)/N-methyltransferase
MWLDLLGSAALGGLAGWQADRLSCRLAGRRPAALTEAAAAITGALAWGYAAVRWPPPHRYAWMGWLWVLMILADLDLRECWLPDLLTLPLAAGGLLYRTATGEAAASVYGLLAGAGLLGAIAGASWLVYRREVFGEGDVKLAAALGAWLTWPEALSGFAAAFIAGGAFGAAVMAWRMRLGRWRWGSVEVPFGPFLVAGAVALTVWMSSH